MRATRARFGKGPFEGSWRLDQWTGNGLLTLLFFPRDRHLQQRRKGEFVVTINRGLDHIGVLQGKPALRRFAKQLLKELGDA